MPARGVNADGTPLVLGGSLHRDDTGRLCTIMTTRGHVDPQTTQALWNRVSQKRYPREWDGQPARGALVIYWSEPIQFSCHGCGRSLGKYRTYEAGLETGLVESKAVEYVRADYPVSPEDHTRKRTGHARPYEIAGEVAGHAAKTHIILHCKKCNRTYRKNMQKLATQLVTLKIKRYDLDIGQ